MLKKLFDWFRGENIEVEVVAFRKGYNDWLFDHTLVKTPEGFIRYVKGHVGVQGEKITVNTWELSKYGDW